MKKYFVYLLIPLLITALECRNNKTTGYSNAAGNAENAMPVNEKATVNAVDSTSFQAKAASGGMMEVELGKIAQKNAKSQAVKDFGERMVKDHSKASDELKTIAASQKIELPKEMLSKNQKMVDKLSGLTGSDFDKEYMKMMVNDHKEDISDFEKAAKDNSLDKKIKEWASKTLPTLKKHLELAQSTLKKVK